MDMYLHNPQYYIWYDKSSPQWHFFSSKLSLCPLGFIFFFGENIFSLFLCDMLVNEFFVTFVQRSLIWNHLFVKYVSNQRSVYFDRLRLHIKPCFMKGVFLTMKRVKPCLILDYFTVFPILWSFCSGTIIH